MAKVYLTDEGTKIRLNCGTDISTATVTEIHALNPDGTEETWTGALYSTQYIDYIVPAGGLDNGKWKLQAYVETPTGKWLGETCELVVYNKWK